MSDLSELFAKERLKEKIATGVERMRRTDGGTDGAVPLIIVLASIVG